MSINFQFRINHVYCPQKYYLDQIISDDAHKLTITLKAVQELQYQTFRFTDAVQLLSCIQIFCDPMDCSPPGSSVHGISQAIILQQADISSSKESSRPRDQTSALADGFFTTELPGKPIQIYKAVVIKTLWQRYKDRKATEDIMKSRNRCTNIYYLILC